MKHRKKLQTSCEYIKKALSGVAGLSLLETIIALSVMAFIVISFSLLFANNYKIINNSGQKSATNYTNQSSMENYIAQGSTGTDPLPMTFKKEDGSEPIQITVTGSTYSAGTLTSFLPSP